MTEGWSRWTGTCPKRERFLQNIQKIQNLHSTNYGFYISYKITFEMYVDSPPPKKKTLFNIYINSIIHILYLLYILKCLYILYLYHIYISHTCSMGSLGSLGNLGRAHSMTENQHPPKRAATSGSSLSKQIVRERAAHSSSKLRRHASNLNH